MSVIKHLNETTLLLFNSSGTDRLELTKKPSHYKSRAFSSKTPIENNGQLVREKNLFMIDFLLLVTPKLEVLNC